MNNLALSSRRTEELSSQTLQTVGGKGGGGDVMDGRERMW